jgi:hypothetical protein
MQVLLSGTRKYKGQSIVVWADISLALGEKIRWNGANWVVNAQYGTRYCGGMCAQKREKPRDEEEH